MWDEVIDFIRRHERFVLSTHVNPEGDAIGAEIVMAALLEEAGKQVTIVNSSVTPRNCAFLDPQGAIRVFPDQWDAAALEQADAVIIVDVNNWSHLGPFADALRDSPLPRVCIDHHQGVEDGFANIVVCDTTAAAAGLLAYELARSMGHRPSPRMATAAYAAIITDTGTFRFSNTDERVLQAAKELIAAGVKPFEIHRKVFAKTRAAVKLLGSVLNTMDSTPDGKLAWVYMTQDVLAESGAEYEDSDGIVDVVRAIEDVEFVIFFKETDGGAVKASLRSNGRVDVFDIARRYGGGGHRMASGMTLDGPIGAAINRVVRDCSGLD